MARYLATNFERLAGATRRWVETWYDSSLPYWLLDRTMATVQRGREQLQVHTGSPALSEPEPVEDDEPGFFDQDV